MRTKIIIAEQWPGAETHYFYGEGHLEHMVKQGIPYISKIDWIWVKRTVEYPTPKILVKKKLNPSRKQFPLIN